MLKIYKASAGSGKTYQLTKEYIHLLFDTNRSKQHRRILAVTFTNKATEEMKTRILEELYILATEQQSGYRKDLMAIYRLSEKEVNKKAEQLLIEIVHDYSSFSISTIDSFFQQVIRAFAREIGVNGAYALELNSDLILEQAVDNLFFELDQKENKQLLEWMTQFAEDRIDEAEDWNIKKSLLDLGKEIFKENYQHKASETSKKLHDKKFLSSYRKSLRDIVANFDNKAKTLAQGSLKMIEDVGLETQDFKGGTRTSINTLFKIIEGNYNLSATFRSFVDDVSNCYTDKTPQHIKSSIESIYYNGFQTNLQELINLIDTELQFRNSSNIILKHLNTLGILSDLAMQIKKLTKEQNSMLISDSNLLLNRIIEDSDAPFIYEKTAMMLEHYMIDEFQDTSVLQWKNFRPLVTESMAKGKDNLVVGDVKQSIYRWRNSDWKLLANQISEDFKLFDIQSKSLDTNYRSDKHIVEFNNTFFKIAADSLQTLLNGKLEENNQMALLADFQNIIHNAYADTVQQVKPSAGEGRVQFVLIDESDTEEKWKKESLKRLPSVLEDFQDRGYKPSDVAVLVRTNQEEKDIVQFLLKHKTSEDAKDGYSYDIMGTEGLMIESAHSVKFLLAILRLFVKPDDVIQRILINFQYAHNALKKPINEALRLALQPTDNPEVISPLFSEEENQTLSSLKQFSLFEMIEKIIALFDLTSWYGETPFLQAFQDVIFEFSTSKSSDIHAFVQWWEKAEAKQYIATPENEQAFRIMTIHKSKGLAFGAVIMPFCDWKLDTRARSIIWAETNESPFNTLPLMPVEYTQALGNSVFAETYFREMMHAYIDSLNVAYVAFTRPKHELVVFAPLAKLKKDGTYSLNNFSTLLTTTFINPDYQQLQKYYSEDKLQLNIGTAVQKETKSSEEKTAVSHLMQYPISDLGGRLKLKHSMGLFNREEIDITETPLDYGNMMHEIFCRIEKPDDHIDILQHFIREGRLKQEEAAKIAVDIDAFWKLDGVSEWFKEGVETLNETTILTPEGYHYRPDRIILEGKTATVIDYKFGEHKRRSYERQVQNYLRLLREMGYEATGWLCYVKLGEVNNVPMCR